MPKALFDELKTCYSGVQIAELTFAVAGINAWNRIAISIHRSV
jgi:alkylhydroperoxidase family enzyme